MKRLVFLLTAVLLLTTSCATGETRDANNCARIVAEGEELLLACVEEMERFDAERIYVSMEETEEGKNTRLVSYGKESDKRTEIESEILKQAFEKYGFRLIFFQTASNSRRCVIFSFAKEKAAGTICGIYYSYDSLPCAWWGRNADLIKKDGRWLQIDRSGDAAYFTLPLSKQFYYFEKYGDLLA